MNGISFHTYQNLIVLTDDQPSLHIHISLSLITTDIEAGMSD
jgi:hypothetical protein